jgi:transcriptional regulator with XRE-family HTH domain
MPSAQRRLDQAHRLCGLLLRGVAEEFRHARVQAGLSQAAVAEAAGLSRAELGRIERASATWVDVDAICRVAVVLGLAPSLRLYPEGRRLRDSASLRVLEALRVEVHPSVGWATEVPLALRGDRRAWDAVITGSGWRAAIECETRLFDVQALERRVGLKRRDDGEPNVLLVLPATRANSEALATAGARLRTSFPLDSRVVLAALRRGRDPGNSGIVLL